MNEIIHLFDTGIAFIGLEELSLDNLPVPDAIKIQLQEDIKEGMSARVFAHPINERFLVTRKEGRLTAKKLTAFHVRPDGYGVMFNMGQESDGSRRLIDILPIFLNLASVDSKKVFVIDEIDRSLHSMLTRTLIETYLDNCTAETRTQLLMTTHDVILMDQQLLRRDEMWVTERNTKGETSLASLSEYMDIRFDLDIRKGYMQGRFGGIPRILLDTLSGFKGYGRKGN
jgi:AAA15 family ATPase/GTPase